MTDLMHDDTDLRARFGALASDLDLDGGDLTAVRARGNQRRRRQQVGTGLAGIVAVVAAVGIATQLLPGREIDVVDTPGVVESPVPDDGPVNEGPLSSAGWEYLHLRYGDGGVTWYQGSGDTGTRTVDEPVETVIALPAAGDTGAALVQLAEGSESFGGGAIWVRSGSGFDLLVEAAPQQRLLTYRDGDNTAWLTRSREDASNEFGSVQVLYSIEVAPGSDLVEHGVVGDPDAGLDSLAFGRGVTEGQVAWVSGHLATSIKLGTFEDLFDRSFGGREDVIEFGYGFLVGLEFSPDGSTIASVVNSPGVATGADEATTPAELILWDSNGEERGRVELPATSLSYTSGRITFGLGAQRLVAFGDRDQAYVVEGLGGDHTPSEGTRVRTMDQQAGVVLYGGKGQVSGRDDEAVAALYDPVFYPEVGRAAYLDQQTNGDRPGTWRSSALDVAVSFIENVIAPTANGAAANDRPETDSGEGYHVTLVDVWLGGVEPTSGADPTLVVSLRRIDGTMSYWVDQVRPYAESARPLEEPEFRLTSVGAAQEGWDTTGRIDVNGYSRLGTHVFVVGIANAGRYEDGANGELDENGSWFSTVYLEGRATEFTAVIALALDENGAVLSAYSVSIPPGPFAAG